MDYESDWSIFCSTFASIILLTLDEEIHKCNES